MLFQLQETLGGRGSRAFPQLVQLIQQTGIGWIRLKCLFVTFQGPPRVLANVEPRDPQISPRNGEVRISLGGTFPHPDGLFSLPFVIQQIPKIIGSFGVTGVSLQSASENEHLLEASREAVSGGGTASLLVILLGFVSCSALFVEIPERIENHRISFFRRKRSPMAHEKVDGLAPKPGVSIVECDIDAHVSCLKQGARDTVE